MGDQLTTPAAVEALTDIVLYITIYAAVITTLYAMGEPQSQAEGDVRKVAMILCGIASVLLLVWLGIAITVRAIVIIGGGVS